MIPALLLLLAAPPPAVDVVVARPKQTLPVLPRLLTAMSAVDPRFDVPRTRRLAGGLVDPFDPAALEKLGVDVSAPIRLVRVRADARPLLLARLAAPKRFDAAVRAPPEGSDVVVEGEHVVIGANRRWQTILRRDGARLFAIRATRALGLGRADTQKLIGREGPVMAGLVRDAPRRIPRPKGDVAVTVRNVEHVTSLELTAKLAEATTDLDARLALDAFATSQLGDLVAKSGARRFLEDGEAVVEVAANVPRAGLKKILGSLGIGSDHETFVTGRVEAILEKDGGFVVAIESKDARRATQLCEALGSCSSKAPTTAPIYPGARVAVRGRVVAITFGQSERGLREAPKALGDGLTARVQLPHLFEALAARSRARDGAPIDAARLAMVRFTYGSITRLAKRVVLRLSRSRHGFVAAARLFH
ncbi:MAG: hypothetical protein RIT81_03855 [Deltaproteobacteria bacterium]